MDLRCARLFGLLELVESAQNQPILIQIQVVRQGRMKFEVERKSNEALNYTGVKNIGERQIRIVSRRRGVEAPRHQNTGAFKAQRFCNFANI